MTWLARLAKRLSLAAGDAYEAGFRAGLAFRVRYRRAWAHVFFVVQFSNPAFSEFQIAIATIGLAVLGGDLVPFLFGCFHLVVWCTADPDWRARAASASSLLYALNTFMAAAELRLGAAFAFALVALSMGWAWARLSRRLG